MSPRPRLVPPPASPDAAARARTAIAEEDLARRLEDAAAAGAEEGASSINDHDVRRALEEALEHASKDDDVRAFLGEAIRAAVHSAPPCRECAERAQDADDAVPGDESDKRPARRRRRAPPHVQERAPLAGSAIVKRRGNGVQLVITFASGRYSARTAQAAVWGLAWEVEHGLAYDSPAVVHPGRVAQAAGGYFVGVITVLAESEATRAAVAALLERIAAGTF